jgi:hypothetical protein
MELEFIFTAILGAVGWYVVRLITFRRDAISCKLRIKYHLDLYIRYRHQFESLTYTTNLYNHFVSQGFPEFNQLKHDYLMKQHDQLQLIHKTTSDIAIAISEFERHYNVSVNESKNIKKFLDDFTNPDLKKFYEKLSTIDVKNIHLLDSSVIEFNFKLGNILKSKEDKLLNVLENFTIKIIPF